jgi:hypothetical protein
VQRKDDLRGACPGVDARRHNNLVFGGSHWIRTMMQSCASAARLLGGGSHSLPRTWTAMPKIPSGHRRLGPSWHCSASSG